MTSSPVAPKYGTALTANHDAHRQGLDQQRRLHAGRVYVAEGVGTVQTVPAVRRGIVCQVGICAERRAVSLLQGGLSQTSAILTFDSLHSNQAALSETSGGKVEGPAPRWRYKRDESAQDTPNVGDVYGKGTTTYLLELHLRLCRPQRPCTRRRAGMHAPQKPSGPPATCRAATRYHSALRPPVASYTSRHEGE